MTYGRDVSILLNHLLIYIIFILKIYIMYPLISVFSYSDTLFKIYFYLFTVYFHVCIHVHYMCLDACGDHRMLEFLGGQLYASPHGY